MNSRAVIVAVGILLAWSPLGMSADLPRPSLPAPAAGETGIWGAIAYSPQDGRHGFFWGADKRREAEENALRHCKRAGGDGCAVVSVFRNHRHWDDDGSGFPYEHCAALATGIGSASTPAPWAAASAGTRKEAEELTLRRCETSPQTCKIKEWVCT